jgi:hypothetical protein
MNWNDEALRRTKDKKNDRPGWPLRVNENREREKADA